MTPPHSSSSDSSAIIGIDVGSTSVRAIAFDVTGHRLAVGSRPTPLRRLETGGEYDPDALFAAAVDALSDVSSELNGRPVAGIAATSIGESCVLVDEAGRSLAPSIAWYDKRTLPQTQSIERALGRERIFEITGHAAEPIFTLTKLLWMREHWPDALTGARRVLMIADWIAFRLCGVMASEPMLASRTLYFDIRDRCWSGELLALAGLNDRLPAPLKPSGTALGPLRSEVLSQTGLAGKPVVGVGGHDHIVGAMVAGLLGEGLVVDSAGTAEGLMTAAPSPLMDPDTIRRGYVQGAIETDRRFSYVVGGIFSSGAAPRKSAAKSSTRSSTPSGTSVSSLATRPDRGGIENSAWQAWRSVPAASGKQPAARARSERAWCIRRDHTHRDAGGALSGSA